MVARWMRPSRRELLILGIVVAFGVAMTAVNVGSMLGVVPMARRITVVNRGHGCQQVRLAYGNLRSGPTLCSNESHTETFFSSGLSYTWLRVEANGDESNWVCDTYASKPWWRITKFAITVSSGHAAISYDGESLPCDPAATFAPGVDPFVNLP